MKDYVMLNIISFIMIIGVVMVSIMFITLLERKILSYIQNRKGPNKVLFEGIFQPLSDALKLFSKEIFIISKVSEWIYFMSPMLSVIMLMMVWVIYPVYTNVYCMVFSMLFMIIILSLNSFMIMMMGWSSNSLYSVIGFIRTIAQMLSYEVNFIMIIMSLMIMCETFSLSDLIIWQKYLWFMVLLMPMFLIFFISILAELNRSPMDFIEGESELVSGFNVEYYSGLFSLIFIGEYGMIIFMSYLLTLMYFGVYYLIESMFLVVINMMIFMRGVVPRMRYDELMYLCWKIILPLVLNYLFFLLSVKVIYMLLI